MKINALTLTMALLLACPALAGTNPCTGPDWDSDGTPDVCDNCSDVYNQEQYDGDQDGYGDQCDGDYSGAQNNYVDGLDFTLFAGTFGTYSPPTSCEYDHGINGYIDGLDFTFFASFFGQAPGPACDSNHPGTKGTPCPTPGAVCP